LAKILKHRNKKDLSDTAKKAADRLEKIKRLRNALTHGYYIGKTSKFEYFFTLLSDVLIDDKKGAAHELVVATLPELTDHLGTVVQTFDELNSAFQSPTLHELLNLPARVLSTSQEAQTQAHSKKQRQPRAEPSQEKS
jgi:hypothetical protein